MKVNIIISVGYKSAAVMYRTTSLDATCSTVAVLVSAPSIFTLAIRLSRW